MAKKGGDAKGSGGKMITTLAMTGGVFVLRKLLATGWTKATGRTPPTDLTDPEVSLPEALAWAVATGLVVETARFFITRTTMRRQPQTEAEAS